MKKKDIIYFTKEKREHLILYYNIGIVDVSLYLYKTNNNNNNNKNLKIKKNLKRGCFFK